MRSTLILLLLTLAFGASNGAEVAGLAPSRLQKGDLFGCSLSAYETFLAVGALGDSGNEGSVSIFNCTSPANCTQQLLLTIPDTSSSSPAAGHVNDTFGESLAVYEELLIIGAPGKASNAGLLYTYNCSSSKHCEYTAKVLQESGELGDGFGYALAVDDFRVIVSAPGRNNFTGTAYLLDCSNATRCTLIAALEPDNLEEGSVFGVSVGIAEDLVVIGARGSNQQSGSAYVFNCSSGTPTQTCILIATLTPPSGGGHSSPLNFGASLAVGDDDIIYIGAPGWQNNAGAVFLFNCSQGGGGGGGGGAPTCEPLGKPIQPPGVQPGDLFGSTLIVDQQIMVIGSQGRLNGQGGAYLYACFNHDNNCDFTRFLSASDGEKNDLFGWALAITTKIIMVGAPGRNQLRGEVYTYQTHQPRNNDTNPTAAPTPSHSHVPSSTPPNTPTPTPSGSSHPHTPSPTPTPTPTPAPDSPTDFPPSAYPTEYYAPEYPTEYYPPTPTPPKATSPYDGF